MYGRNFNRGCALLRVAFAGLLEGYDPSQHWVHGVDGQPQHPANCRGLQRFREARETDQAPGSN